MPVAECTIPGLSDELFRRAIEIFLAQAYRAGVPPRVRQLLDTARPDGEVSLCASAFEVISDPRTFPSRVRYDLRVGWDGFPHLKVSIESTPDGTGPLFSVNTH